MKLVFNNHKTMVCFQKTVDLLIVWKDNCVLGIRKLWSSLSPMISKESHETKDNFCIKFQLCL
jgi:hypothetical protein